jgi:xylulose-5-phosphate/fructose-6-phosphate phosphoketolase
VAGGQLPVGGQIYLMDNPRLLGHWGTTPGLNFVHAHLNRAIITRDLDMIYVFGPGHGGPAAVAAAWLDGRHPPSSATPARTPGSS